MKHTTRLIFAYIVLTIGLILYSQKLRSQNVMRNGNVFIEKVDSTSTSKKEIKTKYIYQDKNGKQYPVYLTGTGKAFIKKVSKKTGNEYRMYLPKVTEQLGTDKTKKK